ncbi:MAG: hypothetical protein ACOCV1_06625 [Bacillota bacterium]
MKDNLENFTQEILKKYNATPCEWEHFNLLKQDSYDECKHSPLKISDLHLKILKTMSIGDAFMYTKKRDLAELLSEHIIGLLYDDARKQKNVFFTLGFVEKTLRNINVKCFTYRSNPYHIKYNTRAIENRFYKYLPSCVWFLIPKIREIVISAYKETIHKNIKYFKYDVKKDYCNYYGFLINVYDFDNICREIINEDLLDSISKKIFRLIFEELN